MSPREAGQVSHGDDAVPCIRQEQRPCMLRTKLDQSVSGEEKKEKEAVPVLRREVEAAQTPQVGARVPILLQTPGRGFLRVSLAGWLMN